MFAKNLLHLIVHASIWIVPVGGIQHFVYLLNCIQADNQTGDYGMNKSELDSARCPATDVSSFAGSYPANRIGPKQISETSRSLLPNFRQIRQTLPSILCLIYAENPSDGSASIREHLRISVANCHLRHPRILAYILQVLL